MRKLVLLLSLLLVLVLSGCSAGGADSESASGGGGTAGAPAPFPAEDVPRDEGAKGPGGDAADLDRSVIRTGRLTVSVPDVEAARREALELVERADGRLESESSYGAPVNDFGGAEETTELTFRVPPDELDALADDLADLGRLVSRDSSAVDVTDEVIDAESRIESLETSVGRLRTLLAEADDVGELVAVESELTTREAELESLQARYRALQEQVGESTLTLLLYKQGSPLEEDQSGFLAGLAEGWEAFKSALVGGLTVLGALTPFLVVFALVGGLAWALVRSTRRRSRPGPPGDPGPAPRQGPPVPPAAG